MEYIIGILNKNNLNDIIKLSSLLNEMHLLHYNNYPTIYKKPIPKAKALINFKQELNMNEKEFIVAKINEKVVGGISIEVRKSPDYYSFSEYGFIDDFIVDKDFHRKGIGKSLKIFAIEMLRKKGVRFLISEIDSFNIPSLKLSKSLGYKSFRESLILELD